MIVATMQLANKSFLANDTQFGDHSLCSPQHALQFLPANKTAQSTARVGLKTADHHRPPQITADHCRPPQDRMGSCEATNLSLYE